MKIFEWRLGGDFVSGRRFFALLAVLALAFLVAVACGEAATATPEPTAAMEDEGEAMPEPTAMPDEPADEAMPEPTAMPDEPADEAMPEPTAMPDEPADDAMPDTGIRPRSEWTVDNPATKEEIEAELEKYRGHSLVFSSWGGAYQSAQRQAYGIPMADQFGIEVIDDGTPLLGKIRAMEASGNITWHVIDQGGGTMHNLGKGGSLEDLDFSIIDNRDFLEILKASYMAGGGITWSEVWAYNADVYPEGNRPDSMDDFYDPVRFPGKRAWAYYPHGEIKFVLLSDNPSLIDTAEGRASLSAPNEEQVDRAFELFDEYRDQVDLIWSTGSDCPQLLISGDLDMCTAWNGRIFDAAREGAPLNICWECGFTINTDAMGIIKGLRDQDPEAFDLAQLFIAWTSLPEVNARISLFITYGPINLKSIAALEAPEYDEVRDQLPSSGTNIPYAIFTDEEHGTVYDDAWRERYDAWKLTLQ